MMYNIGNKLLSKYYRYSSSLTINGFLVEKIQYIPELDITAHLLKHISSKSQYLHLHKQDDNNVFAVAFPTFPNSSSGEAHILEHVVLCGSNKFPVRDPFFKMLNRSLASYMNAWTGSDYTMYPFSTTNMTDYKNLRDIYMDAVFHPLLLKEDFWQEGWRLEYDDSSNPIIKGVVYNEMKGALYSDSEALFATRLEQLMFPGTSYSHVSGGDPEFIPKLTHSNLLEFYKTHYHPSQARFYTFGNIPLEEHTKYLDSYLNQELKRFPAIHKNISLNMSNLTRFTSKRVQLSCIPDPLCTDTEKQSKFAICFLANDVSDTQETFNMNILSQLLLDGPSSPFYKSLLDTQLGSDYAPGSGYDSSTQLSTFTFGLQGVSIRDIPRIEDTIRQVLYDISTGKETFPIKRIDAILHGFELGQKHKSASFGLNIASSIMKYWIKDISPIPLLQLNRHISSFKDSYNQGELFKDAIQRYMDPMKCTQVILTMTPDSNFKTLLQENEKKLTNSLDTTHIALQMDALSKAQTKNDDLSVLPTLTSKDIPINMPRIITWNESYMMDDDQKLCQIFHRNAPTNGLSYVNFIKESKKSMFIPIKSLYLPLLCSSLTSLGTLNKNVDELDHEIKLYTGGINIDPWMMIDKKDLNKYKSGLRFSSFCMNKNIEKMFSLLSETLLESKFSDLDRLKTIVSSSALSLMNSISDSSHIYAKSYASSQLLPAMMESDLYSGLSQVLFMNQLAHQDISCVADDLDKLYKEIKSNHIVSDDIPLSFRCALVTDSDFNHDILHKFITNYTNIQRNPISFDLKSNGPLIPQGKNTWFAFPFPVAGIASSMLTVPRSHPDSPKFRILSSILSSKYLHKEIREKNGAYGGGMSFSPSNGILSLYSYRDPSPLKSLNCFLSSIEWFLNSTRNNLITDRDLEEAKLSIFKSIDAPIDLSAEGMEYFESGYTIREINERRSQLLKITMNDLIELVERWFKDHKNLKFSTAIIGCGDSIPYEISNDNEWKIIEA